MMRRGFTLVELVIAVALGLVVVITVYSALATATSSVTAINRQGRLNSQMRLALRAGLNEADYWLVYDDPESADPSDRALRISSDDLGSTDAAAVQAALPDAPGPIGLPFTPLRATQATWTVTGGGVLRDAATLGDDRAVLGGLDQNQGFDGERPYQANDPRRWYRGPLFDGKYPSRRWRIHGYYGVVSNQTPTPDLDNTVTAPLGTVTGDLVRADDVDADGDADPRWAAYPITWTWNERQLAALTYGLGYYGMAEYLSPNQPLFAHGGSRPDTNGVLVWNHELAWRPAIERTAGGTEFTYLMAMGIKGFGGDHHSGDTQKRTINYTAPNLAYSTQFGPIPLLPWSHYTGAWVGEGGSSYSFNGDNGNSPTTLLNLSGVSRITDLPSPNLPRRTYFYHNFSRWEHAAKNAQDTKVFLNRSMSVQPALRVKPEDWPDVHYSVRRMAAGGRLSTTCYVRVMDSGTGQLIEIPFNTVGTTLRGARRQRRYDGSGASDVNTGWAAWYGPGDVRNHKHLDSAP
ncbi:MAG: prepilin-type N-terminal cleavage/methylation domain-containing protein [Planctomycetota bacterium]|jgi:prepilin-type N-terminal cleavage/methylation domain-containing protein|nr:prepilin-type N-terminal cleavage/methylation domain-containing protein [Planctomycetota bacterium]